MPPNIDKFKLKFYNVYMTSPVPQTLTHEQRQRLHDHNVRSEQIDAGVSGGGAAFFTSLAAITAFKAAPEAPTPEESEALVALSGMLAAVAVGATVNGANHFMKAVRLKRQPPTPES